MITHEHEQLAHIQRWIAAFNAHDVEALVALYAEDAQLYDAGMRRPRRGQGEIRQWFTQRFRQMPTIQYHPTDFFVSQEKHAVSWSTSGRTPPLLGQSWLARPFSVDGVSVFFIQDNRIHWQRGYYDHLQVVERVLPFLRWLPLKL